MRLAAALFALSATATTLPTASAVEERDQAFVDAFAAACVPGRLSYVASLEAAAAAGWTEVENSDHPELEAVMAMSEREAQAPDIDAKFAYKAFGKEIAGARHHLVVSEMQAIIGEPDDPLNPWIYVGCYLYDFDASAPLAPEPVTALIGKPISATREEGGAISHVWGPPCPMPRTLDTYLSFVAEGSAMAAQVPFSGIALNFTTSALAAGEAVPDPYC